MRIITIIVCTALIGLSAGCQTRKKNPARVIPPAPRQVELKAVPFSAPADSVLSASRMQSWLLCNKSLDSLSIVYTDSFKTEDSSMRLRFQQNFSATQDLICLRAGLASGYEEYRWITKVLALPKNRALAESNNIGIY